MENFDAGRGSAGSGFVSRGTVREGHNDSVGDRKITGMCSKMCPDEESNLRLREGLVHFYEKDDDGRIIMIKEYKRSAAGTELCRVNNLRTMDALRLTTNYLLKRIIRDIRRPYWHVYGFVFDRLRSIRQEIVILDLSEEETLELLEPTIIFLAFSFYELCEEDLTHFDPVICGQHLQECLKIALKCYDKLVLRTNTNPMTFLRRPLIESIYLIFNLDSEVAMERSSILCKRELKFDGPFLTSWSIGKSCMQSNYYRAIQTSKQLPELLQSVVHAKHINRWRERLLREYNCAYNSPNVSVPKDFLCRTLSIESNKTLQSFADHYNIEEVDAADALRFCKKTFQNDVGPMRPQKEIKLSFGSI